MKVILAKSAGFCFGVQRAMDLTLKEVEQSDGSQKIYTYGPLIHNDEVVNDLKAKGVGVIDSPEEIKDIAGQTMVIRSHGVAKEIYDLARENGVKTVDATCPFVKKIHNIVNEKSSEGYTIIVIGDPTHPEVKGIVGWCPGKVYVLQTEDEVRNFKIPDGEDQRLCIVSQTTFNAQKFKYFVEIVTKKRYDTVVINTICSATAVRQQEAAEISGQVDRMIVIGDAKSSNTKKLVEICKAHCTGTYHIQTVRDLPITDLNDDECVGITAGASTPHYLIQEVLLYVRGNHFQ